MEQGQEILAHLTSAGLVVYGIERLKALPALRWISQDTTRLNAWLNIIAAAAVSFGINYQYDPTSGTLTITGLTLASITSSAYELAKQWVAQQIIYDGAASKPRSVS